MKRRKGLQQFGEPREMLTLVPRLKKRRLIFVHEDTLFSRRHKWESDSDETSSSSSEDDNDLTELVLSEENEEKDEEERDDDDSDDDEEEEEEEEGESIDVDEKEFEEEVMSRKFPIMKKGRKVSLIGNQDVHSNEKDGFDEDDEELEEKMEKKMFEWGNDSRRTECLNMIKKNGVEISKETMRNHFSDKFGKDKTTNVQKEKLIDWFVENRYCPYLGTGEAEVLEKQIGVKAKEIKKWVNSARYLYWIPLVTGKKHKRKKKKNKRKKKKKDVTNIIRLRNFGKIYLGKIRDNKLVISKSELRNKLEEYRGTNSSRNAFTNKQRKSLINWFVKNRNKPWMKPSDIKKYSKNLDLKNKKIVKWIARARGKWSDLIDKMIEREKGNVQRAGRGGRFSGNQGVQSSNTEISMPPTRPFTITLRSRKRVEKKNARRKDKFDDES